jgi:hypothetical protein
VSTFGAGSGTMDRSDRSRHSRGANSSHSSSFIIIISLSLGVILWTLEVAGTAEDAHLPPKMLTLKE